MRFGQLGRNPISGRSAFEFGLVESPGTTTAGVGPLEIFCEWEFEDEALARQRRDERISELQAQGLVCIHEDLYRIDGQRVYLLTATQPVKEVLVESPSSRRPRTKGDRVAVAFETR